MDKPALSGLAALMAGLLALAPGEAHATCGRGGCSGSDFPLWPIVAGGLLFDAPALAVGLVTDVGIGVQLGAGQGVRRSWSIMGTVFWSAQTLTSAGFFVSALALDRSPEALGLAAPWLLISGASLGLSLAGLLRPPSGLVTGASARLRVFPVLVPTREGLPGVAMLGTF